MTPSERLRSETGAAHQAAETVPFIRALLSGRASLPAYLHLLRNLHAIYESLERHLQHHANHDPTIADILALGLGRTPAIEGDMIELAGTRWASLPIELAATDYVDRLAQLSRSDLRLLIAHAYVRYLGDLSGGQAISRAIAPTLGQHARTAIRFYEFGDSQQVRQLKVRFREVLDRSNIPPESLVEEALTAFTLHRALFDQLAERVPVPATASMTAHPSDPPH
jgi:heme oxygenase